MSYSIRFTLSELDPDIGLYWYFFTEMFDNFRDFFAYLVQIQIASLCIPICVKFKNYPWFCVQFISGMLAILKPYPSFGNFGFWVFGLLPMQTGLISCKLSYFANFKNH